MTVHHLAASPETVHWGHFSAALKPALVVDSGATVVIESVNGGPADLAEIGADLLPEHRRIHEQCKPMLGGHIVTGHVDAKGEVAQIVPEGDSTRLTIVAPAELAPYIAPKGSIAVNGVSLTVNQVNDQANGSVHFGLNIIPHTAEVTTLGALAQGDAVNLEIDTMARYLKRMQDLKSSF